MSRLTDKYQSYAHFKGISFDEASYTSTPTKTGALQLSGNSVIMTDGNFTADGNNTATLQTGVLPNQKYYQFEFDNTVSPQKNARLYYGSFASGNAGGIDDVRRVMWDYTPFDRVCGFWLKMPSNITSSSSVIAAVRFLTNGTSAMITVGAAKSPNGLPAINFTHSTAELSTGGAVVQWYESYTDTGSNVIPIQWDKWYFIAVRKSINETNSPSVGDPATGTIEYKHYINGQLVGTFTRTSWTKRSINAIVFGNNNAVTNGKIGISSWFLSDWDQIGTGGLADIFRYGSPFYSPMKYYDGDSWEWTNSQRVYYDNAWQDVYANRFDGTNWVPM